MRIGGRASIASGSWLESVAWFALAAVITVVLLELQDALRPVYAALCYQLVVLGASARGGRRLGFSVAIACFLAFYYFFVPRFYSFRLEQYLDLLVLATFLAGSTITAQLLHRAQSEAASARARAEEVDGLAALGAEALHAPRAAGAVESVAELITSRLRVRTCEIHTDDPVTGEPAVFSAGPVGADQPASLDAVVAAHAAEGNITGITSDGTAYVAGAGHMLSGGGASLRPHTVALAIPLRVRSRHLGVLRLADPAEIRLDPPQLRFADALSHYAALAVDRFRLAAGAEHADALREVDRLKDALLASVSHDMRTPLTTIKALAHALSGAGDERAVLIETEADRLTRFVVNLLDLSRLNAGAIQPRLELIAAEDVIGAALEQSAGAAAGRTVEARLDQAEPLLIGRFDYMQTLRGLVNLLDNALKYSPADTTVEVVARRDGEWLAFEVLDRGPGIPPEQAERIFEPFARGDDGKREGTGLGLAIARKAAQVQGGDLRYAPRPGGGSVFTLLVPAAHAGEFAPALEGSLANETAGRAGG